MSNKGEVAQYAKLDKGELWKAKQLKEYRRANGLCFRCGDKYLPNHEYQITPQGQIKAIQVQEILSDDVLDAKEEAEEEMHLSVNAIVGSEQTTTIRLRALVGNQIMLMLIDFGSSHSFVNSVMVERMKGEPVTVGTMAIKVANGEVMHSNKVMLGMTWWVQGHTIPT